MAKHNKWLKTLFFIEGAQASEEEIEASLEFEPGVQFRNASKLHPEGAIEAFDRVAGAVPPRYQDAADAKDSKGADDAADTPTGDPAPALKPGKAVTVKRDKATAAPAPNTGAAWGANA
jgi:hypothetical protein